MSYVVNNTRGQIIAVVQDGTINTTATSQTLVGKNVTPYGEYEVENLVHQLENFADATSPGNPIEGQLWYNTSQEQLFCYSGEEWKPVSGMTASDIEPSDDPRVGDFWFNTDTKITKVYSAVGSGFGWLPVNIITVASTNPSASTAGELYYNSVTKQLFAYDGTAWTLIGPEGVSGFATTRWASSTLPDTSLALHAVMLGTVDGDVVSIVSSESFTIDSGSAPTGFSSLVPGINMASGSILNGRAATADALTTPRSINGVLFDGTSNITISNAGELSTGTGLIGSPYSGAVPQTWSVDATSSTVSNKIVSRDALGDFSARVITANLVGDVSGTAQNVRGLVAPNNGGTGFSAYSEGDILIGSSSGGLAKTQIFGTAPISVTSSESGITISYTGGSGSGTVTSVGIESGGAGLSVVGGPITSSGTISLTNTGVTRFEAGAGLQTTSSSGNITVTNTGVTRIIAGTNVTISPESGTGAVTISSTANTSGGSGITQISTGTGLTGGPITTSGTISVTDQVLRGDAIQTVSALKQFTGGIVSQAYNLTSNGNSIFHVSSPASTVQIAVDNTFPHYFYPQRFVCDGNADGAAGQHATGGTIVGVDSGVTGGAGVAGIHTNSVAGLGVGVSAGATNGAFTGAVFQSTALRPASSAFIQIRAYSGGLNPVFVVDGAGSVSYDGTASSPAADYAEYFEWADGNPDQQDRVGISVTLVGNKIRPAASGDVVIGVISAKPAVVGDAAELAWNQKYLTDEFGRQLREAYHVWEWIDEDRKKQTVASFEDVSQVPATATRLDTDGNGNSLTRPMINPAYDSDIEYIPRSQRAEWDAVGLVGKLRLRKGQPTAENWIKLRDINDTIEEWLIR